MASTPANSANLNSGAGTVIWDGVATLSTNTQQHIYYVAKSGIDTNTGLNINTATLTFGHAIALASAQTPSSSNLFSIVCLDDGVYTEDIVGVSYVDIYAPNANLVATTTGLTVADNANYTFKTMSVPTGSSGIVKSSAQSAASWVFIAEITCAGTGAGFSNLSTAGGVMLCEWKTLTVTNGTAIGSVVSTTGHTHVRGGDIYISGSAGTAVGLGKVTSGSIVGHIDHILLQGSGTGTAIHMVGGLIDVTVNTLNATTAYNLNGVTGSTILNLFCNDLTGTETVTNGAFGNVWTVPTFPANQAGMLNGQLVIGSTGANPAVATMTSSAGSITITNGAGTINLETAAATTTWTLVTANTAASVNSGYITNKAATACVITLPATAAVGQIIEVCGLGATGWSIAQNANQYINFGSQVTTTGIGGSLASTLTNDAVKLLCTTTNNGFTVLSSIGNLTVT